MVPPRVPLTAAAPAVTRPAPAEPPSRGGLVLAWLVTLVVLVGAAWGAVAFRVPIAQAWPPSQRVYDALGLSAAAQAP